MINLGIHFNNHYYFVTIMVKFCILVGDPLGVLEDPFWVQIYSQTGPSEIFQNCTYDSCNLGSGNNFINFDLIKDLPSYHFKLVWDNKIIPEDAQDLDRDYALEWTQEVNPLQERYTKTILKQSRNYIYFGGECNGFSAS